MKTKKVKAEGGDVATFKIKAVNQGDLKSKVARLCAKVPKEDRKDVKALKCTKLGRLASRAKRTATVKIKVAGSADGKYKVTFQPKGVAGKAAKAKLVVR